MSGLPRIDYTSTRTVQKKEPKIFQSREKRLRALEKKPLQFFSEEMGKNLSASAEGIAIAVFDYYGLEAYLNIQLQSKEAEVVRQIDGKVMSEKKCFETHKYYLKAGKLTKLMSDMDELSDQRAQQAAEKLANITAGEKPVFEGVFMVEISKNKTRPYRCYKSGSKKFLIDLTNGYLFVVDGETIKRTPVEEKFSFGNMIFKRDEFSKSYKRF